jgi:hypothetical protein
VGEDVFETIKVDLLLQKGWNIVYYIGNYTSKPNTSQWEVDTAIVNITTEKPNIELKWYYDFRNKIYDILEDINPDFIYMPYIGSYYRFFILTG